MLSQTARGARRRVRPILCLFISALLAVAPACDFFGGEPDTALCNARVGRTAPLPSCDEVVCDDPAPGLDEDELDDGVVTENTVVPRCRTTALIERPAYDDSPPFVRVDPSGVRRYACLFEPAEAAPSSLRPLLIWLHSGGAGGADDLYDATSIRSKAIDYPLSNDPFGLRRGFFVLAVQGRNLKFPTESSDGAQHDFYHRDLSRLSSNPDIDHLDRWIDELVDTSKVDRNRIYLMGWGNGGFFAQMYAITRHQTPTHGGNRIAAAAVYSAGDPFNNTDETQRPSCQLDPYPTSRVPIMLIGRACDTVACDEAQFAQLVELEPSLSVPGYIASIWEDDLFLKVRNTDVERLLIGDKGVMSIRCDVDCDVERAVTNHLRWPDGVADRGSMDYEPIMLDFLRDHPLPE